MQIGERTVLDRHQDMRRGNASPIRGLSVHGVPYYPVTLTRMVDCVTWNFDNQSSSVTRARSSVDFFRLQPPRFIQHIVFFFRTFRQREAFTYNTVTGGAGARLAGMRSIRCRCAAQRQEWFHRFSFQNCAIRQRSDEQNNNLRMLNLVYGMAFQRATPNRLVRGERRTGFVYLRFNGRSYGVNIAFQRSRQNVRRHHQCIDDASAALNSAVSGSQRRGQNFPARAASTFAPPAYALSRPARQNLMESLDQ